MKLTDAKITILVNREYTEIQLHDSPSSMNFVTIKLTPEQLSAALSRISHTPCEIEVSNKLDLLGKTMENKYHEFEITEKLDRNDKRLHELAQQTTPEGWTPDNYYGSQNSFFSKDGKNYCRVIIRRYV